MTAPTNNVDRGTIYTFYSFKGGVGRSMALANVAALLAKWGYSVLVVDWDIEAPGIERFYARHNPEIAKLRATKPGVVDLVQAKSEGEPLQWRDCLIDIRIGTNSSRLSLLTAGRNGADYTSRLHALNFPELFDKHDLGAYIEQLRDEWARAFQFVLVDSRTGVTDIGGICTVHLADVLVLFFTTTDSSTDGAMQVLQRARKAQGSLPRDRKQLLAVPVPARDESRTEYEKANEWKDRFADRFGELYRDWLPSGIKPRDAIELLRIPYVPYWSFGEQLPAIEEGTTDPSSLGYSYQILARLLATRLDWYKALEGQEPVPPPVAKAHTPDPNWITRRSSVALEHLLASGLPGFMEISYFCSDSYIEKNQRELLSAAKQAQIRLTGWPIGIVLDDNELRPRPTSEGILAIVAHNVPSSPFPRRRFDYWTLSKGGDFYTLRSLTEDQLDEERARKILYFNIRIVRAMEALLHCASLYKSLGTDPNAQVELRIRYGGLRDRELRSYKNFRWGYGGRNLQDSEVLIEPVRFRLGAIDAVSLVKKLCAPLFMLFDYTEIPDDVYAQVILDFTSGRRS